MPSNIEHWTAAPDQVRQSSRLPQRVDWNYGHTAGHLSQRDARNGTGVFAGAVDQGNWDGSVVAYEGYEICLRPSCDRAIFHENIAVDK